MHLLHQVLDNCELSEHRPQQRRGPKRVLGPSLDRAAWQAHFDRTTALFIDHFGADLGGPPAASASGHGTGCIGCVRPSSVNIRPRPARQSLTP
ncbi:MAG TPA: hypothetical protein VMV07_12260 [Streptosporangiaceae bacterium]|nr:hypothetical protein [Streptosporangiaceae bacterium]